MVRNILFIFPFSWEFHHPKWVNPMIFQRGRAKNHQPDLVSSERDMIHSKRVKLDDLINLKKFNMVIDGDGTP